MGDSADDDFEARIRRLSNDDGAMDDHMRQKEEDAEQEEQEERESE